MNKSLLFLTLAIGVCIGLWSTYIHGVRTKRPICKRCNVVFISVDSLRSDELPCYGYRRNTAPNICRLINQSVMFEHSYSQSSWTLPSHFSYFTSQFPFEHNVLMMNQNVLHPSTQTLPETMKKAGYKTIYSGPNEPSSPLDRGIIRGFDTVLLHEDQFDWDAAIAKLKESSAQNKPTFVYLHAYDLTSYWLRIVEPPESLRFSPGAVNPFKNTVDNFTQQTRNVALTYLSESYDDVLTTDETENAKLFSEAKTFAEAKKYFERMPGQLRARIRMFAANSLINANNPTHMEYLRNLYDNRLYNIDARLGPIIDELLGPDLRDNTIVVFTSDHGEEFGEHGGIHHGRNLYPPTTRVPFSIYIPHIPPARNQELVQAIDAYPTIMGALSFRSPKTTRGLNLMPLIWGQKNAPKNEFVLTQMTNGGYYVIESLRNKQWAYYRTQNGDKITEELFALSSDPGEQKNLEDVYPDIIQNMKATLEQYKKNGYSQKGLTPP